MPVKRWTKEHRAKFQATIAKKRRMRKGKIVSLPFGDKPALAKNTVRVFGMDVKGKQIERVHVGKVQEMTDMQNIVEYWRERGASRILIEV